MTRVSRRQGKTPPQVLYSASAVHQAIRRMLADPDPSDRRVVIVAYVGANAASFLPAPKGLEVICAPEGGTSASGVRQLVRAGATVRFADALRMKVYWSEQRGCVVTSANCSTSALGAAPLREAGVLLGPGIVDIDKLRRAAAPRDRTQADMDALDRRERERGGRVLAGGRGGGRSRALDYASWYRTPDRESWLQSWWEEDDDTDVSQGGRQVVREEFGNAAARDLVLLRCKKDQIKVGDWVLTYPVADDTAGAPEWMYVHRVLPVARNEPSYERRYPFEALQVGPLSRCPVPPFAIDKAFRLAFRRATRRFQVSVLYNSDDVAPPARLLELLYEEYTGTVDPTPRPRRPRPRSTRA